MRPLRIAIISTPRSGNTWVRSVLSKAGNLEQIAVHNPRDIPPVLPERVALQIHWYREPNFQRFLRVNGFRIIVIARHPLDVFVSMLHFIRREPLTSRWLEGNVEIPANLALHPPASPSFAAYATSWGAENLLSVSYQWWREPTAIRAHYEQLVRRPIHEFTSLMTQLEQSPENVSPAVDANTLKVLRETPNRHGWQGTPGLWHKLVLPGDAWRIFRRHRSVFKTLGYHMPSPYFLTKRTALENWQRLAL